MNRNDNHIKELIPSHKGTVTMETERIILRRFTKEDALFMFNNWANDPVVTKYMTWFAHENTETSLSVINSWIEQYEQLNWYQWAIVLKDINEPIGSIGVVRSKDEDLSAEMGYCIGRKYWHKGYTSEALSRVLKFLFDDVGYNRISAIHDIRNPNSGLVMKKCGMKYEGTLREIGFTKEKEPLTVSMYSILKSEWEIK